MEHAAHKQRAHADQRFAAIERLQHITAAVGATSSPGSARFDEADLAISLAVRSFAPDSKRSLSNPEFFTRNVRRDARSIRLRTRRVVALSAIGPTDLSPAERNRSAEELVGRARTDSPDLECAARDLEDRIRGAVENIPNAPACLDAMLENEPPSETARRLALPERRVHYVRQLIRAVARKLLMKEAGDAA